MSKQLLAALIRPAGFPAALAGGPAAPVSPTAASYQFLATVFRSAGFTVSLTCADMQSAKRVSATSAHSPSHSDLNATSSL